MYWKSAENNPSLHYEYYNNLQFYVSKWELDLDIKGTTPKQIEAINKKP